jgi:hypothetical protein
VSRQSRIGYEFLRCLNTVVGAQDSTSTHSPPTNNSSLEGNTRRAIDVHEDDEIDEKAFTTLIRAAVSLNESSSR